MLINLDSAVQLLALVAETQLIAALAVSPATAPIAFRPPMGPAALYTPTHFVVRGKAVPAAHHRGSVAQTVGTHASPVIATPQHTSLDPPATFILIPVSGRLANLQSLIAFPHASTSFPQSR